MSFSVVKRMVTYFDIKCDECGFTKAATTNPMYADRNLKIVSKHPCKHCAELERIEALPLHHKHIDGHSSAYPSTGSWFCCGATQMGSVGIYDCVECGEPWPCKDAEILS